MPLPTPPKARGSRLNMKALGDVVPSTSIQHAQALDPVQASGGSGRNRAQGEGGAQVVALKPLVPATYEQPASSIALPSVKHKASVKKKKAPRRAPKAAAAKTKLFVLDTNVLLHDPTCLFHFEEHDVFIPMIVLEELDGHKKGLTDLARNARQVSRWLDQLAGHPEADVVKGLDLSTCGHAAENQVMGRLFFQTEPIDHSLPAALPQGKADNQILGVFAALKAKHADREVILVSKDINIRVKARALGLEAEDYSNDHTLDDASLLYAGWSVLPEDFWEEAGDIESWQEKGINFYRVRGDFVRDWRINEFVTQSQVGKPEFNARVEKITGNTAVLRTVKDYGAMRNSLLGINARNREQNYALNLLMDPDVDFVTLAGNAGTGKTLMVLASALSQVLDDKRYSEIIITRVTVPVADDIGFLPGNEEEKMAPWMGAVDDNLEVLAANRGSGSSGPDWGRANNTELIRSKIKIKSLNFMRGRTFLNKFLIVDEAQNLTPKQMKTLITRAGPGTKIVCLGNLGQIDTPYLTEGSSGLTYAVERFKGWAHSGHITLAKGERSRLADFASEIL